MVRSKKNLFFSLKQVYYLANQKRSSTDGFLKKNEIFFHHRVKETAKSVKFLPTINNHLDYKYIYNLKKISDNYFNYFFERSCFFFGHNTLYSCKFKSSKDIFLLRRYKTKKKFTNILFNSVFYAGSIHLLNLFFTTRFIRNNYRMQAAIFRSLLKKTMILDQASFYSSIKHLLVIFGYFSKSKTKSKFINNFFLKAHY